MSDRLADIRLPRECREMIRAGALVSISTSGGKDSQAMTVLLSRIVPRDRLVAVHAPLGEVEWPNTVEFIRATLPPGMPLILAPVASGKSLLDSIEERGRFPSPKVRWCTSSLKRGPIERELRRYLKANPRFGGRIVSAMGMRAGESPARARKSPWRLSERNSRAGRTWFDWLPIFDLTETRGLPTSSANAGTVAASGLRHGHVQALLRLLHHGLARRSPHRRAASAGSVRALRPPRTPHRPHPVAVRRSPAGADRHLPGRRRPVTTRPA